ncbi:MAG TPA: choice-of-anchor tandem repeat GloVer-containing protein [Candidatus Acidoferrum sp.]|jgi:uncharacterized repeat protein (TIGR03803 family)|nr:choice-of-anchor tandem repeat GloVer-containing protein [Candidatus Acidoferrum sp.]
MIVSARNRLAACIGAFAFALTACGAPRLAPLAQDGAQQRVAAAGTAARSLTTVSFQVLHRFGVHAEESRDIGGVNPDSGLTNVNGTLYGSTVNGGKYKKSSPCFGFTGVGCGVVYSISTTGTKKILHYFLGQSSGDGNEPAYDLINVKGTLYGTTSFGGNCGSGSEGTVYGITTAGSEKVLHTFCGSGSGATIPTGGVIDVGGTLYGPAGPSVDGDVYSVSASGAYKVLYAFRGPNYGDGYGPYGNLLDVDGTLYGVTYLGGAASSSSEGYGMVYALTTAGKEKVLYSFQGPPDGSEPFSGLINVNGTLYGTTFAGGKSGCQNNFGCGVVYSITTSGSEKVLYRFKGGSDGGNPDASLLEVNGTLYGTTAFGGTNGLGTIFSFNASGGEQVLHSFGGSDGADPEADLIDVNGTLYGTTYRGGYEKGCGGKGCGTVFALTP